MINRKTRIIIAFLISFCISFLFFTIIADASTQNSYVEVEAESNGGSFNFTGSGAYWNWNINLYGFDLANIDLTNEWDRASSTVKYEEIGDGEIFIKVSTYLSGDEFYYFDWIKMPINGDGIYSPGGGRSVTLINSTNVTGYIEYPKRAEKAIFLFDTTHHSADLKVIVHNGELLENATVSLINGDPIVKWTDKFGECEFSPGTGNYHLIVEHENFSSMLVDELRFESDKSYIIRINMTDCLISKGTALCAPDADDLIMYYKSKDPVMGSITPQGYVDYFADQLRTCKSGENNCADGTLQIMADDWGIYPKNLNVLLYSCNITNLGCINEMTELEIKYIVKNYQQYKCNWTVNLIYGNKTIELGSGILPATWSEHSKWNTTAYVTINECNPTSIIYLAVQSKQII